MKNSTTIPFILQSILSEEEVKTIVELTGYKDTASKFTVYHLLQYWCQAALNQWDSYRSGADYTGKSGLMVFHYSRFSTKAAEVPFAVFKSLFRNSPLPLHLHVS